MTPNKIISHFHNYLCILIVLKKLLLYVILAQKYKKYFRNHTLFIKCSSYKSPKKKAKCSIVMLVPNTTKDVASYTRPGCYSDTSAILLAKVNKLLAFSQQSNEQGMHC